MTYSLLTPFLFSLLFNPVNAPAKEPADLILYHGVVHTLDERAPLAEAIAVRNGKILAVGSSGDIRDRFETLRTLDLSGKHVYPGFIDAHCHFVGFAEGLRYVDLTGSRSFDEVLDRLQKAWDPAEPGWLVGRGWDQNLWKEKVFPDNVKLNEQFPATPVMLIRIDGHVVLANQTALNLAAITGTRGFGEGQVGSKNGRLTGILSETAADAMRSAVPHVKGETLASLLDRAQQLCFAAGLTLVCDAGLEYPQVMELDSLQNTGRLKMQVYAMLIPGTENFRKLVEKGPWLKERLFVRSLKIYADGSLGSRTARLKQPYSDAPGTRGILVTDPDTIRRICRIAIDHGYQVCTHCIGDEANHLILNIYGEFLKGKNDLRWRIEHAQVVDPADQRLFGDFSVVPSVQATHATSDMRWAGDRLGAVRVKGAYAYRDLMLENGWIANGTDFPIEDISPLKTFYASVARKDPTGYPAGGYQPENALNREDALRSITLWAARAGFLEQRKGSLETGKDADIVILDQDILTIPENHLLSVRVLETWVLGEQVFHR